jgi:dCMP deaminase
MGRKRLSWDQLFMKIAETLAERSSCVLHQVGCVFVDGLNRIITVGYNGSPRGDVNCTDVACAKLTPDPETGSPGRCRGAHSEINAIINCTHPERLRGSTLYITTAPCYDCMKALVQVGVEDIIYRDEYVRVVDADTTEREDESMDLARRMGIAMYRYDAQRDERVPVGLDGGERV